MHCESLDGLQGLLHTFSPEDEIVLDDGGSFVNRSLLQLLCGLASWRARTVPLDS